MFILLSKAITRDRSITRLDGPPNLKKKKKNYMCVCVCVCVCTNFGNFIL